MMYILTFCIICALICWACCGMAGRCDDSKNKEISYFYNGKNVSAEEYDHLSKGHRDYLEAKENPTSDTCSHIYQKLPDELPDENEIRNNFPYLQDVQAYRKDHSILVRQCIKCGEIEKLNSDDSIERMFFLKGCSLGGLSCESGIKTG